MFYIFFLSFWCSWQLLQATLTEFFIFPFLLMDRYFNCSFGYYSKILCNWRPFTKFHCFLNLMLFSLWRWLPFTAIDYCHWSWRWNPKILECIPFAEITGNYLLKYRGKSLLFSCSAPLAYNIIDWIFFSSSFLNV